MKKKLRYLGYLAALTSIPMTALATSGWTDYVPVAELTPTSHGRFLVKLKAPENPSDCKNKDTFYHDYNAPGSEQIFRTLLEAISSGKKVRVYVSGKCELKGYSEITSVSIVP
ncbi:MAG: hypothetical protein ACN4GM_08500 [Gammaproteobacteria bacterium]